MDKTALITGSTKGIGKQVGLDLLNRGYYVCFSGHTPQSTLQLENELFGSSDANIICQDLSTLAGNEKLVKYLQESYIELDYLILNLGITDRTPFGEITYDNWKRVFDVNLNLPFMLIQLLKNNLRPNGRIIFISSISGLTTDSVSISYGVSKAAINMLVSYLAKEFKDKKITVNAIAPGYIMTDWHRNKSEEQLKRIANKCLANRFGTPEEISKAVLAIIDNDFINGQVIRVDGGFNII